ncbi:hypothetical protein CANINC_003006 [Pichia inconspicua]|uniref:Anaphase spindle elongation protein n=1 Tax=Pichia inconspicua TaxID=52247 RepID=A0A4T0X065_9ASCO|nr:hypothetical protein CANINC_003006 [[Candida] inconspicua]
MDKISDLSKKELLDLISQAILSKNVDNRDACNDHSSSTLNVHNDTRLNDDHSNSFCSTHKTHVKIESDDSLETIYVQSKNSPTVNIGSTTSSPAKIVKPFQIPIHSITTKLDDIQKLVHLLGNNDNNSSLQRFYTSLNATMDDYNLELLKRKDLMNSDFIKSLETITKIFQITSKFSPIENVNESVLTPTIRKMIMDYNSNIFKSLEAYCINNDTSMLTLNNDIEENLIRLIPVLSSQLLTFNKQLKTFYNLYELVDDYTLIDQSFLEILPTKEDINLFKEINKATDIKIILQTNFSKINPLLIDQLNSEIRSLEDYINLKLTSLKNLIQEVANLNHELYTQNEQEYFNIPSYINNNELLLTKTGIKSNTFDYYEDKLHELKDLKSERESILNSYMSKTEQLWSILRPNSTEIQSFLTSNHNLYLHSLKNFEALLNELEVEKLKNIKTFIISSREKIEGFWKVLMYDEESKHRFQDFFVNDTQKFDEELLTSHSNELERLRKESEQLKPLLLLISQLDDLIAEKLELDKSLKDPSRLLKRNSFQILKQEERTQRKLQRCFPQLIEEIKIKIEEFQTMHCRIFKLNGEPYLNKLQEIENTFIFGKRKSFRSTPASLQKRNNSKRVTKPQISPKRSFVTPSRSIIRKLDPDQMTNPFLSHEPTPLKTNTKTPTSALGSKFNFTSSNVLTQDNRSPPKLNLNASTKITTFSSGIKRRPMGIISPSYSNNENIPTRVFQNIQKKTSPLRLTKRHANSIPVEELSDSILDYSDNEASNLNKENIPASNNELFQHKKYFLPTTIDLKKSTPQTQHYNLSLDSETF